MIASILKSPWAWVPLALHVILATWLSFVPLFDSLGFERAFATGVLASFTAPTVALWVVRKRRGDSDNLGEAAMIAMAINLLSIAPSLLAGVLVETFTTVCDPSSGLGFWAIIAGGNAVIGTVLGLAFATLTKRRWLPGIGVTLTLLLYATMIAVRLYREPQIFVYSLPFGFWPGSLYDEELAITPALVAFRIYGLLLATGIYALLIGLCTKELSFGAGPPRPSALALAVLAFSSALWVSNHGRGFGFDLDRAAIADVLSKKVETAHFVIHVDPSIDKLALERLVADHELRYAQLLAFFKKAPAEKIHTWAYADVEQKGRLMGAKNTMIARPWAREIHIHGYDFPHPVLKHELAHVFAGELTEAPFKVPARAYVLVNIGVVEGIAVAADWRVQELTVHEWAKTMRALNLAPDLRRSLDIGGFWSLSSARAYTAAGSFIRWLVDEQGIEKFAVLYQTSDFQAAYGRPLEALVGEWETFVDALSLPDTDLLVAEHRFKQPAIFQKVCAHRAANLAASAQAKLGRGDFTAGIEDLEQLLSFGGDQTGPRLLIADTLAKAGKLDEAQAELGRALSAEGISERSLASVKEATGNLAWRKGDPSAARAAFQEVLKLHLSTASDRLQYARIALLEEPSEVQDVLRPYLLGELGPPQALVRLGAASRSRPDDALLHYLYGKALENNGLPPESVDEMRAALGGTLPAEPISFEAQASLGRMLYAAGRNEEARWAFEALAAEAKSTGPRLEALDWAARATFALTGALPAPE